MNPVNPSITYNTRISDEIHYHADERLFYQRQIKLKKQMVLEAINNPFTNTDRVKISLPFDKKRKRCANNIDDDLIQSRRKMISSTYGNTLSMRASLLPELLRYSWEGDLAKLKEYLENNICINVHQKDFRKRTALHYASSWGNAEITTLLLGIPGIDVNAKDMYQKTSLRNAVECKSMRCIQILIENGADPNTVASDKLSPFIYALRHFMDNDLKIISYMYENCGDTKQGPSCLHQLTQRENRVSVCQIAEELIFLGANINATDKRGRTPIMYAVKRDMFDLARVLLERGADLNLKDEDGNTVFAYTRKNSKFEQLFQQEFANLFKSLFVQIKMIAKSL